MRNALVFCVAAIVLGQDTPLRTTSRLVVAPVSVIDPRGHPVEGLTPQDLVVYDKDVVVQAQVEDVL